MMYGEPTKIICFCVCTQCCCYCYWSNGKKHKFGWRWGGGVLIGSYLYLYKRRTILTCNGVVNLRPHRAPVCIMLYFRTRTQPLSTNAKVFFEYFVSIGDGLFEKFQTISLITILPPKFSSTTIIEGILEVEKL